MAIDVGEGYLEINGIRSKGMHLWEDTCLEEVKIHCESSEGKLSVYNIFDLGWTNPQGGVRSQVASCGMLVEQRDNVYVYHCNDAGFQTNFDKLVFEIEFPRIKEQWEQVDDTRKSEQTCKTNGLQKVFRVITAKLLKI